MLNFSAPPVVARIKRYRVVVAVTGVVAVALVGVWVFNSGSGNAVARPEKVGDADGAFKPTDTQWASLKLATVRQVAFRDERTTDGKIGINEETTTPVFSPFSGRVSKLIAKPGDPVTRGTPLFAIEASEFVQGQNDLVSAVAGVEKAKSRLLLGQTIEKRQRELFSIRGGALKDLEQAQSDLIGAQGDLRSAEIALAAVRNRLRILGRGDEEIALLEKSDRIGAETIVGAPIGGTVIQRKIGLGQYINVGATDPIYTVGDLSTVWLIANVRESDAPRMKVGAAVEVSVLAHPGRIFNARLTYVAPALDPNTRRLPVRAEKNSRPRAAAGDVREFPHHLGRGPPDAGGAAGVGDLRGRQCPRLGGAAQREVRGVARRRTRRHDQRPGRGAPRPCHRRNRGCERHAVHRPRRATRLIAASSSTQEPLSPCKPSSAPPSSSASSCSSSPAR